MKTKSLQPKLTRLGTARKLTQGGPIGLATEADGVRLYNP